MLVVELVEIIILLLVGVVAVEMLHQLLDQLQELHQETLNSVVAVDLQIIQTDELMLLVVLVIL